VKLVAVNVPGAMSSENTAETLPLMGAPVVGPGLVVAGTVWVTVGAVVSVPTAEAVVKVQM
jgi:hypothetical protein